MKHFIKFLTKFEETLIYDGSISVTIFSSKVLIFN